MVGPTNLKPRLRRAELIALDSGVSGGTSDIAFQRFTMGAPPTKFQIQRSKVLNSPCTSRNALALAIAASILALLRTIAELARSLRRTAASKRVTFFASKFAKAFR